MRLSGSMLDRAEACAGSVVLPQRRHESADTDTGRDVHGFLDDAAKCGRDVALAAIDDPEAAARCAAIDLDSIPAGAESEVALAYDPETDTTERLQLDGHRRYPDGYDGINGPIPMTLDRVGALEPGARIRAWIDGQEVEVTLVRRAAWVGDFKTGKPGMRASDALQIRAGCLAVARYLGVDEAYGALLYLRPDGKWRWDRASFDTLDLDAIRQELLAIRAQARRAHAVVERGGIPQLVPGLHCEHCAAAVECPAIDRQRQELARIDAADLVAYLAALPPDRRGAIVEMGAIVAKKAEQVHEAAKVYVDAHGPIDLPSGRQKAYVATSIEKQSDAAKAEIAALKASLRERGEIVRSTARQLRIIGKASK